MTGEEIWMAMAHTFDKEGNSVPPVKRYETLTQEEKIALLEWRNDILCEEFSEECREFANVIWPLRPHNDRKRFPRHTPDHPYHCPTFYDGCNCTPDHTQEEYNDLKEENSRLKQLVLIAWQVFGEQMKPSHREQFLAEYEKIIAKHIVGGF